MHKFVTHPMVTPFLIAAIILLALVMAVKGWVDSTPDRTIYEQDPFTGVWIPDAATKKRFLMEAYRLNGYDMSKGSITLHNPLAIREALRKARSLELAPPASLLYSLDPPKRGLTATSGFLSW